MCFFSSLKQLLLKIVMLVPFLFVLVVQVVLAGMRLVTSWININSSFDSVYRSHDMCRPICSKVFPLSPIFRCKFATGRAIVWKNSP